MSKILEKEPDCDISIFLDDSLYDTPLQSLEDLHVKSIPHSVTTDTLDSVALGPSPSEENLNLFTVNDVIEETSASDFLLDSKHLNTSEYEQSNDVQKNDEEVRTLKSYFQDAGYVNNFADPFDEIIQKVDFISVGGMSLNQSDVIKNTDIDSINHNANDGNIKKDLSNEQIFNEMQTSECSKADPIEIRNDTVIKTEDFHEIGVLGKNNKLPQSNVDFIFENENISNKLDISSLEGNQADFLTEKEKFEHFTAEGDEEGLENLSVSPRLNTFIPPSFSRQSNEMSTLPMNISELSPAHIPSPVKVSNRHENGNIPFDRLNENILFSDEKYDDAFTATLKLSDKERRQDSWIPSEATKQHLSLVLANLPGPIDISEDNLCYPAVVIADTQVDPVHELVERYLGQQEASKRQILTVNSVPCDETGLETLITNGSYWSALSLTTKLLSAAGQGVNINKETYRHAPWTLQLWLCRFKLYLKLHAFNSADVEMKGFGNLDSPDLYYEFYPSFYPGRKGSMAPFSFRLLHAELPHYMGRTQEALDRLYFILSVIQTIVSNLQSGLAEDGTDMKLSNESLSESLKLWTTRELKTLYSVANTLLAIKDYSAALQVYEELLVKDKDRSSEIYSGIGRIYIQMGNSNMAKQLFSQATYDQYDINNLINKGLTSLCEGSYPDAWQNFSQAVAINPLNVVAVSNMAVCSLYMGKLKEALTILEGLIYQHPEQNLHEGLLFNLCTLYELESTRAFDKKLALLQLISRYKGDGFPLACLQMA